MKKKQKVSDKQIRQLIAPQVEKFKREFPEWNEESTQRLVEMLRPYSLNKIQAICYYISKTPLVEKVVKHRTQFGAETVISEEAKSELSSEVLTEAGDKVVVAGTKGDTENIK